MPRLPTVLAGLMILGIMVHAQDEESRAPTLITNSPFLPPGFQPPGRPGTAAPLPPGTKGTAYEFRGVYQLQDTWYFSIYNPVEKKGMWLTPEGDNDASIEILDFNPEDDELVLSVDGETQNLTLVKTSDTPMPVTLGSGSRTADQQVKAAAPRPPQGVRRRVIRPGQRRNTANSTNNPRRRVIRPNTQQ